MANTLAFFPWVYIDEPIIIGSLKLLPYRRNESPGNLPHITQTDIDGVFSAYADRPNHPVNRGVILEFEDWQAGMEITQDIVHKMFQIRHKIACSALSTRTLFNQSLNYCNYDTYTLVVQKFLAGNTETFAFTSRRRDGGTNQFWGVDEFAFQRPNHVDGNSRMFLDEALLKALLSLPPTHHAIYEAIVEFNLANSDSPDVPEHVEVVMCKSAFEWLLGIDEKAISLVKKLQSTLADIDVLDCPGHLKDVWFKKWSHETRLLDAWAKDFCALRGSAAHGKSKATFVWKGHQHLAFIAIFFPLLLKKILADDNLMTMGKFDLERFSRIDRYLANDPFNFDWNSPKKVHPWVKINTDALVNANAKLIYPD